MQGRTFNIKLAQISKRQQNLWLLKICDKLTIVWHLTICQSSTSDIGKSVQANFVGSHAGMPIYCVTISYLWNTHLFNPFGHAEHGTDHTRQFRCWGLVWNLSRQTKKKLANSDSMCRWYPTEFRGAHYTTPRWLGSTQKDPYTLCTSAHMCRRSVGQQQELGAPASTHGTKLT